MGPMGPVEPHLVGGYHWDCSDWCGGGGALPGISEVAGSERPDSSSPASPASPAASPAPRRRAARARRPASADSEPPAPDARLLPDARLSDDEPLRARTLREPDAASLITMLEERNSLLGDEDDGSGSELSANLCEIEESDAESEPARAAPRHTDV